MPLERIKPPQSQHSGATMLIKLAGGTLYDPSQDWNGMIRDIFVRDGWVVPGAAMVRRATVGTILVRWPDSL
jgi:hypothetical protein